MIFYYGFKILFLMIKLVEVTQYTCKTWFLITVKLTVITYDQNIYTGHVENGNKFKKVLWSRNACFCTRKFLLKFDRSLMIISHLRIKMRIVTGWLSLSPELFLRKRCLISIRSARARVGSAVVEENRKNCKMKWWYVKFYSIVRSLSGLMPLRSVRAQT